MTFFAKNFMSFENWGEILEKKEKLPNRQLLKYVHFIYSTHDSLILVRIILIK